MLQETIARLRCVLANCDQGLGSSPSAQPGNWTALSATARLNGYARVNRVGQKHTDKFFVCTGIGQTLSMTYG